MKQIIMAVLCLIVGISANAQTKGAVYLTAGQSNADGREYVAALPDYLKSYTYQHLRYKNCTQEGGGEFRDFAFGQRFAFCDICNYFLDQAAQQDFYAIKCTYGGTAIDTAATYDHLPVWCADADWIARNNAYRGDINTGKSLTRSLTEGFADLVDGTLSKLADGYDVKAIMWHQGESDRSKAGHYKKNFSDMIQYMRQAIASKTGQEKDKTLPFIFGTISHNSKQYSAAVEQAQKEVAAELPNVYWIDMSDAGLRSDNLHFDGPWTEYLGKMMYNKLVELGLVAGGEAIDVEKPHIDTPTDTVQVEVERRWDFAAEWTGESKQALEDDPNWTKFQSLGYRYGKAITELSQLTAKDSVLPEMAGLYFKCGSGNRMIIKPEEKCCFYGDNLYLTLPKVQPGQLVTIITASAKGERGLTTDSGDKLELVKGGVKSTQREINQWRVKADLSEPTDLVFHSNGGAIYVYSIEVATEKTPDNIRKPRTANAGGATYNVAGLQVPKTAKGLVIRDGVKYCLK